MHKKYFTAVLLVFSCMVCVSADPEEIVEPGTEVVEVENASEADEYSCPELEGKVASYTKMRTAGIALLVMGGIFIGAGGAMVASANGVTYYSYNSAYGESGNLTGGLGASIMALGIPCTIAGAVLTAVGVKKLREYRFKIRENKCSLQAEFGLNAIVLNFLF
jgi:hypothetical protein